MADKFKAGVIGLGMGKHHLKGLQKHEKVEVVAIADLDTARLESIGDEYNVKRLYEDGEEMIEKESLDIVAVATPNFLHAPLSIQALKSGAHVICEKPMAMNVEEAEQMKKTAESNDLTLMINFSFRYSDVSFALKEQIESGILGDIYFARTVWHRRRGFPGFGGWFGQKEKSGGGPLIDLGVHRIDLALWLMGNPKPLSVYGVTYDKYVSNVIHDRDVAFDCEDMAVAMIKLEGGITLIAEISWALHSEKKELMRTDIYGTKASAVQRNVGEGYTFEGLLYTEENGAFFDKKFVKATKKIPSVHENLIDVINGCDRNYGSAQSGVDIQKILSGIYESARRGKEITF